MNLIHKIVGVAIGIYVVAYVAVPSLQALVNITIAGTTGTMITTVLPVMAVLGMIIHFLPSRR